MEYQGIIFDFNGTLFFDNDKHVKAWNEISKILRGKEITLEELHTKLNGTPNIQNILYFTDGKATKEELEKYSQKKEEYYRQFCKEDTENIDLVINLENWQNGKAYDRLGIETEHTDILGIKVPSLTIPIKPGRNLAIIVEVAAMNQRQRKMGYNAAQELNDRLLDQMGV